MSELLNLAAGLIELEGGAADPHSGGLAALLPTPLSAAWNVPEEIVLRESADADPSTRLAYGTELLERMLQHATRAIAVAHVRLETAALRVNQVQRAAEQWSLRNGVVEIGEVRLGAQARLWIDALATLHGDEKRELLVSSVVSSHSDTPVEGFAELAYDLREASQLEAWAAPHWSLVERALACCLSLAEAEASGFRAAMTRRFERDQGAHRRLLRRPATRAEQAREETRSGHPLRQAGCAIMTDRAAKLDALSARFVLRIEAQPVALRMVQVDGAFIAVKLRRRKATRTLELEYDAATRRLVPAQCDSCLGPAFKPAACDGAVHLLCERCAPRAEGRIVCAACATGRRAPHARSLAG